MQRKYVTRRREVLNVTKEIEGSNEYYVDFGFPLSSVSLAETMKIDVFHAPMIFV